MLRSEIHTNFNIEADALNRSRRRYWICWKI